ncbi:hypothetical protein PTSG_07962 [Salpingoeca rosetta]|uniref:Defective in cullin neddylation protein n=1 Tax=Salpingoeca rosetta (strain ATCC 50818 / BSB-021) TaxID=946362 RepID=F2UGU4_SALR5|nr:uncharacterized protein PTSG_07962 [Salpingoeca rosetta]EGD75844.1 hypothetical protein PTSG_07962 [Salpingoeca rosetta]|eukprot:XP_004991765.1 hypothetical protein PTSG_07962 [Salpingoeca rosetta]
MCANCCRPHPLWLAVFLWHGTGSPLTRTELLDCHFDTGHRTSNYSEEEALKAFQRYAGDEDKFGVDGVLKFCEDLNVTPEDVAVLVLAYKAECQQMGCFTKEEFLRCFRVMDVATPEQLASKIADVRDELDDPAVFRAVYRFAFKYALSTIHPPARNLDLSTAKEMWHVLLARRWPLTHDFFAFLDHKAAASKRPVVITRDQWFGVHDFAVHVAPDLSSGYSEDDAWPVLLDEFVAWKRERDAQQQQQPQQQQSEEQRIGQGKHHYYQHRQVGNGGGHHQ